MRSGFKGSHSAGFLFPAGVRYSLIAQQDAGSKQLLGMDGVMAIAGRLGDGGMQRGGSRAVIRQVVLFFFPTHG